ncbi:MAG: hypothetical protein EOO73_02665 [Myxococcales bacterium]|nr:MAG: hypothetical protein EOO73_02665 [Myxococcales bacterium]
MPAAARAQEPASTSTSTASARASAEALFEEGVRLSEQNQHEEACRKFEASQALDEAVGTLLRLADCRERTGRYASAWARFREAGSLAETQGMKDRARIAAVRSAALEPKLSRIVLEVPPAPPAGYTLKLGELTVPSGSWGTPLPLDPGTVSVEAAAPGYVSYRRYVAIPAEQGARVKVTIPPLEARPPEVARSIVVRAEAPPPPAPKPVANGNGAYTARVVGLSLAATGGVGLAAGGVLGVIAKRRNDDARAECPGSPRECTPRGAQLRDESERLTTYAVVSAAAGGGLLLTGLIVYFTAPSEPNREQVALGVGSDGRGGLSLQAAGSF